MITSQRLRLYLFAAVIVGGFFLLLRQLWSLQIDRQDEFIARQPETNKVFQRVPGPRGEIRDRNGVALARNISKLEVALNLADVENYWKEHNKHKEVPKWVWDPAKDAEPNIIQLLNETLFPKLDALGLYQKPEPAMIEAIRIWFRTNRGIIPFPYSKPLERDNQEDYRTFAAYAENAFDLPGITLRDRPIRTYPLKALGAHYLGYIRQADKDAPVGEETKWNYFENDDFGVEGLEKSLDKDLRGTPGRRVFLKNEHGRVTDELTADRRDPVRGGDVYLTIDSGVQSIAEMALREAVFTGGVGVGRGAVTVIDPNTGEILAMATVPSYDPNTFIPSIKPADWEALRTDPFVPLLNRSLAAYAPGSTFKIVTGLAASLNNTAGKPFNCSGYVYYGRGFPCWTVQKNRGGHGTLNMTEAIMRSCNCYFYQCGNAAGIDNIDLIAKMMGIGSSLGIGLDYKVQDFMPTREWWETKNNGPWTQAKTANVSIGQGEVLTTPLDMAIVAGAIASGGKVYHPTLINRRDRYERNPATGDLTTLKGTFKPELKFDLLKEGVKQKDIENLRQGMIDVVNKQGGTAGRAKSPMGIAGKTGSAQMWRIDKATGKREKDNHAWFVAFAPYDNPKIAVAVVVANGEAGGAVAAPVGKRVIERTLAMIAGNWKQPIMAMEPAKGHFQHVDAITYPGDEPIPPPGEEESADSTGEETEEDAAVTVKPVPAEAQAAAPKVENVERAETGDGRVRKSKFKKQSDAPDAGKRAD